MLSSPAGSLSRQVLRAPPQLRRAGPNLFATKLSDQRFLETVIQGRKGMQMPAFGSPLSLDEVWQIHAFVKSTDRY
jgi:mono/diheme cytochrome c family protein